VISLLVAGAVSLLVSVVGTPALIRWLQVHGIGQPIREDGPRGHITKAGTPTMGGVAIVAAAFAGYTAAHLGPGVVFTRSGVLIILTIVGAGLVGLTDDWIKVRRQHNTGLSKRAKLTGQLVVASAFAVLAVRWVKVSTVLSFTRNGTIPIDLGSVGWALFAGAVIIATSNAVNLTDGLDGLAAGSATFAFGCLAIIGYWVFRHPSIYHVKHGLDLALVSMAMTGACAGFLWWNAAPARIIMGDTGALGIGAALAALTLKMNLDLLLPIIGGLYVLVTLSVVIQVVSFRLFHRRVFRMAPLHHHFELMGWPETTVIVRFWILSGLCTALALGIFYADFLRTGHID